MKAGRTKYLIIGTAMLALLAAYGGFVAYKAHLKKIGYIYQNEVSTITPKELIDRAKSAYERAGKGNKDADELFAETRRIIDWRSMNESDNAELMYALALVTNDNSRELRMMKAFALATDDKAPDVLSALYLNYLNCSERNLRIKARNVAVHKINSNIETLDRMIIFGLLRRSTINLGGKHNSDYILEMGDIASLEEKLISDGMVKGREDEVKKMLEEDKKIAALEELRPKLETLEKEKNKLESEMNQYVTDLEKVNAKPDDLTFGIRADGTKGYMLVSERFFDKTALVKAKMLEINELRKQLGITFYSDEELARYNGNLVERLAKDRQTEASIEDKLILDGIARDAGCSAATLLELAKIHSTFARRLKSIVFGRKMVINAEKQYHQQFPFTDYTEIRNLKEDAHLPAPY